MDEKIIKAHFVPGEDEEPATETIWCHASGNNWVIDNIPFYVGSIASGDIISVRLDGSEGIYNFDNLVMASGNSTVRIRFAKEDDIPSVRDHLITLGCESEIFLQSKLVAVNIPRNIDYRPVRLFLNTGENEEKWDYEESCMEHSY